MKRLLVILVLLVCVVPAAQAQRFVKVANTFAELLALNPNDVHTNVFVVGGFTFDDGLGGLFSYKRDSATATNAYNVLKPNAYNGRYHRILSDYLPDNVYIGDVTLNTYIGTYVVPTFDDMRLIEPSAYNRMCVTQGNLVSEDGGGRVYTWIPTSTDADDGISVALPDGQDPATPGRWVQL